MYIVDRASEPQGDYDRTKAAEICREKGRQWGWDDNHIETVLAKQLDLMDHDQGHVQKFEHVFGVKITPPRDLTIAERAEREMRREARAQAAAERAAQQAAAKAEWNARRAAEARADRRVKVCGFVSVAAVVGFLLSGIAAIWASDGRIAGTGLIAAVATIIVCITVALANGWEPE